MGYYSRQLNKAKNEHEELVSFSTWLAQHPEYHLYADLQESLPRFMRQVSEIEKKNWDLPLNHRGLPF